ncbi:MAG: nuclear transport factor 2 family protein [Sphingomonadales bacterium]
MAEWHPFFVHFTIALILVATALLVAARVFGAKNWASRLQFVGYVNLWIGAGFAIISVIAGIDAFNTVTHDTPAHLAMKDHRLWALSTATLAVLLAVWSARSFLKGRRPSQIFLLPMLVLAALILITGGKGAALVYSHGLGVASLPDASNHEHHGEADHEHSHDVDLSSPLATVRAFHHALGEGDKAAVEAVLAPDVMIFESGYAERSFKEYEGHHMPADMEFAGGVHTKVSRTRVIEDGALAWVVSDRHTQGKWKDQDINSLTLETVVLRKEGNDWRIAHIHWSARKAPEDLGQVPADEHSDDHEH